MADLASILTDPNFVSANDATKKAIFEKYAPQDINFSNANEATQQAIRAKFGVTFTEKPAANEGMPGERKSNGLASKGELFTNLAAGALRGAGSIGATILAPVDILARQLGVQNSWIGRNDRREAMDRAAIEVGANPKSLPFKIGQVGTEIAGTLPIGGLAGKALLKVAPAAAPLAQAITTGGFKTGLAPGVVNVGTKAAGGAVSGGLTALAVNPEDMSTGAVVGAVIPTVGAAAVKLLGTGTGWLYDAIKGKLGEVAAGRIARDVASGDIAAIKAANAAATSAITSGQAAADVNNTGWAALAALAKTQNPANYFSRLKDTQEADRLNKLAQLAGGASQAEARATRGETKTALNALTTPMRETELAAANTAGQVTADLGPKAAQKQESLVSALQNQGQLSTEEAQALARARSGKPGWLSSGERAQENAAGAADFGVIKNQRQAERDFINNQIGSLEAHGLKPLDVTPIIKTIESKITDPSLRGDKQLLSVLNGVKNDIAEEVARNNGVADARVLNSIRTLGINQKIEELLGNLDPSVKQKLSAKVLSAIKPAIDTAIETAGGTNWRNYLSTFEKGMHGIEQTRLAAEAMQMYKNSPANFIKLIEGNNTKAVEDIFGSGSYDIVKEMGRKIIPLREIAGQAKRDIKLGEQATEGGQILANALEKNTPRFNFPPSLSTKVAIARQSLREFEGKVRTSTLAALSEGMKSGESANAMLEMLPAGERIKVLKIMRNSTNWNPLLARGAVQSTRNALAPDTENQNSLNTYSMKP